MALHRSLRDVLRILDSESSESESWSCDSEAWELAEELLDDLSELRDATKLSQTWVCIWWMRIWPEIIDRSDTRRLLRISSKMRMIYIAFAGGGSGVVDTADCAGTSDMMIGNLEGELYYANSLQATYIRKLRICGQVLWSKVDCLMWKTIRWYRLRYWMLKPQWLVNLVKGRRIYINQPHKHDANCGSPSIESRSSCTVSHIHRPYVRLTWTRVS